MTGARLWELSRARWKIECLFRDLKQNLSLARLPCGGKEAADLSVCLPLFLYTSLQLDPPEDWRLEKREPVGTMVKKIREFELERSLNLIVAKPKHEKVQILRARRSRVTQKPVNSTAGKVKSFRRPEAIGF